MVGVTVATLIAAAVADNFDASCAWVIVGFAAAACIVGRFPIGNGDKTGRNRGGVTDGCYLQVL
jgi:hypothetical protein